MVSGREDAFTLLPWRSRILSRSRREALRASAVPGTGGSELHSVVLHADSVACAL